MLTRLISCLVILIGITTNSFGAEESGMPQLNPEYWISQIFWLIIIFASLYIVLSQIILPKISESLETRKSQVLQHLEQAEKFKEESEKKIQEYDNILNEAKNQAKKIMNESRKKINQNISEKKNQINKEIEKEIYAAEEEIKILKKNSINNINKIAIETSTEIVKSIMEVELNKSSISTIVKDVSRKKIEKYLW